LYSCRHLAQRNPASASVVKISLDNSSSRNLKLKLSTIPFCHGAPGSMYSVLVPLSLHYSFITSAMNSLPLSLRIFSGAPRIAVSSSSTIITSCDFNLRETSSAIFSRVYSSSTTNILIGIPLLVRSKIKSMPHNWFLRVDCLRTMPDPRIQFFAFSCGFLALSDLLLARHGAVVCDSRANLHDPTSLACIANHVADACVRVRATVLQGAFDMCSQQVFFAARFDVGQPRDTLVVARRRREP
jgi:hypothetical protein